MRVIRRQGNYLLVLTWCYAVYVCPSGETKFVFAKGFGNEDEADDYITEQIG